MSVLLSLGRPKVASQVIAGVGEGHLRRVDVGEFVMRKGGGTLAPGCWYIIRSIPA